MEESREIQGIRITDRMSDHTDRQVCILQKDTGLSDSVIQQILLNGKAGYRFEQAVKVGPVNIQMVGNVLNADGITVMGFDVF